MQKIEVKNVMKRFDDRLVLDNVSFSVERGEIFGLIGPNGAGKSTLINVMIGMLKADNGFVYMDGLKIQENSVAYKSKIGYVPQDIALIEEMNAYDNLEFFGSYYGLFGKVLKERIQEALEMAGLQDKKKQKVKTLSGGLKRRLNIAVAMMHHPEVLIMDEPTVGVDAQSRNYIFDFIKEMNKSRQTTIIYTSHYMEEVEQLCQRIFIMDQGKKVSYGTKGEIKRLIGKLKVIHVKADHIPSRLIETIRFLEGVEDLKALDGSQLLIYGRPTFTLEPLIQSFQQHEVTLASIHIEEPSLEEVFLSLTGKRLRD